MLQLTQPSHKNAATLPVPRLLPWMLPKPIEGGAGSLDKLKQGRGGQCERGEAPEGRHEARSTSRGKTRGRLGRPGKTDAKKEVNTQIKGKESTEYG